MPQVDRRFLQEFLIRLAGLLRNPATVYLTGGSLLIYHGIRPATTDIDFGFDASGEDREALPELAQQAAGSEILVQCAQEIAGWSMMPMPGYRERAITLLEHGPLTVKEIHPVDLVMAKIHRGLAEDIADGRSLADYFSISRRDLEERFKEIYSAFPASTEKGGFRKRFERFIHERN